MRKMLYVFCMALSAVVALADGEDVRMKGVVTFAGDGEAVVVPFHRINGRGTLVRFAGDADETEGLRDGDDIIVTGKMRGEVVECGSIVRRGNVGTLESPSQIKGSDFRKGVKHLYRVAIRGELTNLETQTNDAGRTKTYLTILYENQLRSVCVNEDLSSIGLLTGDELAIVGVLRATFDAAGDVLGVRLDVTSRDGVTVVRYNPFRWLLPAAVVLSAALLVATAFFAVAWIRSRRQRAALEIVANERKRIAAELHDTLEQHFAGAKILIAGALRMKDVGDGAAGLLRQAADILANAKLEVRDAVMGLRDDMEGCRSLEEELVNLAKYTSKKGIVNVRTKFVKFTPPVRPGMTHDVISIVREAVTNAVKHGKAKNIAIVADGNALRILNDGERFDPGAILGPETGHFGVSGMRERAARNGVKFEFVTDNRWCGICLIIPN